MKGSSFVVSKIAANSLLWVGQGYFRSNLSGDRPACVTGLSILLPLGTRLFRDCKRVSFGMDSVLWGTLGLVARPWSSSRLSCGERFLLRCDGNAGNSFQTTQGKDPSSGATRRKRASSGCARDARASSRVETGKSGNFLSCSKGVKDPLEVPEVWCD